jgi:ribosome-associated heat shock protein Hsp15
MMERLRIDKWLWAARFYKTRSLACEQIGMGRVMVNGLVVKPARELKVGDSVELRIGVTTRTVIIKALSDQRASAPVAASLFEETAESTAQRAAAAEQRRLAPEPALGQGQGRPTKRDRRETEAAKDWGNRWSASID